MPYIPELRREQLKERWERPHTSGELNYEFTRLIVQYIKDGDLSYQAINDVIGALEGAKKEFYRRIVEPYEDGKILENGDVYQDIVP